MAAATRWTRSKKEGYRMPPELIDIICKIVEQVSDNCSTCPDCNKCLYNGVFCADRLDDSGMLPEDWDYELLRKRLRGESNEHSNN